MPTPITTPILPGGYPTRWPLLAPEDGQVLRYNIVQGRLEWVDPAGFDPTENQNITGQYNFGPAPTFTDPATARSNLGLGASDNFDVNSVRFSTGPPNSAPDTILRRTAGETLGVFASDNATLGTMQLKKVSGSDSLNLGFRWSYNDTHYDTLSLGTGGATFAQLAGANTFRISPGHVNATTRLASTKPVDIVADGGLSVHDSTGVAFAPIVASKFKAINGTHHIETSVDGRGIDLWTETGATQQFLRFSKSYQGGHGGMLRMAESNGVYKTIIATKNSSPRLSVDTTSGGPGDVWIDRPGATLYGENAAFSGDVGIGGANTSGEKLDIKAGRIRLDANYSAQFGNAHNCIYGNTSSGLVFSTGTTTGAIAMVLTLSRDMELPYGGITIPSAQKLYFDGGVDTYIHEESANRLVFVTAGTKRGEIATDSFRFRDGYVYAPGLAFLADTNTGIFRPASDTLAIATGSVERMRLSPSGTVAEKGVGVYGVTPPTVQPTALGITAGFAAGSGASVLQDSTFTGNLGTTAYTLGDLVRVLKDEGRLAL